eukprot:287207_1
MKRARYKVKTDEHNVAMSSLLSDQKLSAETVEDNDINSNTVTIQTTSSPEIFIGHTLKSKASHIPRNSQSISHKNPSLQEFLSVWDDSWSDSQILTYFS